MRLKAWRRGDTSNDIFSIYSSSGAYDGQPRVGGVIAYDTPFLGIHPHVFKHQLTTYQQYVDSAVRASSMWAPVTGGLAAWWSAPPSSATRLSTATWIGLGAAAATAVGTAATAAVHRSEAIQDACRWVGDGGSTGSAVRDGG